MNHVAPLRALEGETLRWCRRIMQNSPTAIACLKAALNADEDGAAGYVRFKCLYLFYVSIFLFIYRVDVLGSASRLMSD